MPTSARGRGRGKDREVPGDRYHDGGRAAGTLRDAVPPAVHKSRDAFCKHRREMERAQEGEDQDQAEYDIVRAEERVLLETCRAPKTKM